MFHAMIQEQDTELKVALGLPPKSAADFRLPNLISKPVRKGDVGLGDPFAYPFRNPESILPIGDGQLLVVNDNNYPMSTVRNPNLPDNLEMIIVRFRAPHDVSAVQPATDLLSDTGGVPLLVVAVLVFVSVLICGITLTVGR